jgi:hypothetical protein
LLIDYKIGRYEKVNIRRIRLAKAIALFDIPTNKCLMLLPAFSAGANMAATITISAWAVAVILPSFIALWPISATA